MKCSKRQAGTMFFAAAALSLSIPFCSFANPLPMNVPIYASDSEASPAAENAGTKEAVVPQGSWNGTMFTNEAAKYQFSLPAGWSAASNDMLSMSMDLIGMMNLPGITLDFMILDSTQTQIVESFFLDTEGENLVPAMSEYMDLETRQETLLELNSVLADSGMAITEFGPCSIAKKEGFYLTIKIDDIPELGGGMSESVYYLDNGPSSLMCIGALSIGTSDNTAAQNAVYEYLWPIS